MVSPSKTFSSPKCLNNFFLVFEKTYYGLVETCYVCWAILISKQKACSSGSVYVPLARLYVTNLQFDQQAILLLFVDVSLSFASSSGVNSPAPAIALNNPSLSPTKVINAPSSCSPFIHNFSNKFLQLCLIYYHGIRTSFRIHSKLLYFLFLSSHFNHF